MVPHRAHLYNSFSDEGLHSLQQAIYLPSTAKGISSLCSIVCSLLFAQESIYLILLQWKSLSLKYFLCYPSCELFSAPLYAVIFLNGAPKGTVFFYFPGKVRFFAFLRNFEWMNEKAVFFFRFVFFFRQKSRMNEWHLNFSVEKKKNKKTHKN